MPSTRLNAKPVSLDNTLELSRMQYIALDLLKSKVISDNESGKGATYLEFTDLTKKKIDDRFASYRREIDYHTIFTLLASIEAIIRLDYKEKRRKQGRFRAIYSEIGVRVRIEDLLDAWKSYRPVEKELFSKYKDALRLRNWLAHGRYFSHNIGRNLYSIDYIYELGIQIQKILD